MSDFYYSDSYFQLELNLQETRRELIALIEACELKDSAIYTETECFSDTEQSNVPPGADLLPKPKWKDNQKPLPTEEFKYDVQSWLQMGSPKNQHNPSTDYKKSDNLKKTPSKPNKSINMESPGKEFCLKFAENTYNLDLIMNTNKISNININYNGKITVDAFFKSFKESKTASKQTNVFDKLTQSPNTSRVQFSAFGSREVSCQSYQYNINETCHSNCKQRYIKVENIYTYLDMDKQPPSLKLDNEDHNLLERPSIAYSSTTVRRAFAVWMYCGQSNKFQHVCNYYHYLEALEDTLPEESRAASRQHELNLFTSRPPLSSYLMKNFPTLYPAVTQQHNQKTSHETNKQNINQKIQNTGTSKTEILEASIMIRDYCKQNMKSLKVFLKEFKEHTQRCGLTNTVGNIAFYIKRKIITSEIKLEANYANTLELMTRNYEDNENVDKISDEGKTLKFNSLILKKTNSLITTVKKNNESKIFHPKINEANIKKINKTDRNKYENKENRNSKVTSYDVFDNFFYYNKQVKLRTKNFSDSNLIIREDFIKASKI